MKRMIASRVYRRYGRVALLAGIAWIVLKGMALLFLGWELTWL